MCCVVSMWVGDSRRSGQTRMQHCCTTVNLMRLAAGAQWSPERDQLWGFCEGGEEWISRLPLKLLA